MNFDMMFPLTPSDLILLIDFVLAFAVAAYFTFGGPLFSWTRDPLGWVIFSYATVTVGLLFLIVWGIVFGQKVDEWARVLFAAMFGGGLIMKGNAMYSERQKGRIARDQYPTTRGAPMSIETNPTIAEIAEATTIWYKGKRVLRTLVQVAIPSFLSFAFVLPIIIEALGLPVDSELRLWLFAVAAGVTAVAGAISRIMAIPVVNAWLTKIGLGTVPQSALVIDTRAEAAFVMEDPKAGRH